MNRKQTQEPKWKAHSQWKAHSHRKEEHLDLVIADQVSFRKKTTLLHEVELVHCALPEKQMEDIRLDTPLLGKTLKAPLVISGMTGGTKRAKQINQDLAKAAETLGIAFGLGSQRPMLLHPKLLSTYQVRKVAPHILLFANLGLMQAKSLSIQQINDLVQSVEADALCLHLNPAMELIQSEGDRDFRGGLETILRLKTELPIPIIIKETGCGISKTIGSTLQNLGVAAIDVSGAGGTSWVGVETKRASEERRSLGEELWDFGIPTAVSVAWLADLGIPIIATGGIRSGMDAVCALALGATVVGLAAPVLRAHQLHGYPGVVSYLQHIIDTIKAVTFLTGHTHCSELKQAPRIIGPTLQSWIQLPLC